MNTLQGLSHLCVFVYIFGFVFRIYNCLIFIQSIISGSRIADRNGDQIEGHSLKAKHFKGNQNRSNRAVRHTTENSSHSAGCAKGGRKPYQLSCHASESGAYAERRNDFASAKTSLHSQCGKEHFPEESHIIGVSGLHCFLNKL